MKNFENYYLKDINTIMFTIWNDTRYSNDEIVKEVMNEKNKFFIAPYLIFSKVETKDSIEAKSKIESTIKLATDKLFTNYKHRLLINISFSDQTDDFNIGMSDKLRKNEAFVSSLKVKTEKVHDLRLRFDENINIKNSLSILLSSSGLNYLCLDLQIKKQLLFGKKDQPNGDTNLQSLISSVAVQLSIENEVI